MPSPSLPHPAHRRQARAAWLLALALPCAARPAPAQKTAEFDMSAYVPRAIGVATPQALQFGRLLAGASRVVARDDAAGRGGRWEVTGAACSSVDLLLTLPAALTGGGGTLAIAGWTADWTGGNGAAQPFTPSAAAVRAQFDLAGAPCGGGGPSWTEDGTLRVRIGAAVQAAADQAPGVYTGTVTLQVTYVDF